MLSVLCIRSVLRYVWRTLPYTDHMTGEDLKLCPYSTTGHWPVSSLVIIEVNLRRKQELSNNLVVGISDQKTTSSRTSIDLKIFRED